MQIVGSVRCVAERVADLGRRLQRLDVVAVGEHLPAPAEVFVEPPGQTNEQTLHAALQRRRASVPYTHLTLPTNYPL